MDPSRLTKRASRVSGCSKSYGSRHSQWEILMRKFSQDCKRDFNCQSMYNSRSYQSQGENLVRAFSKQLFVQELRDHIQGEQVGAMTCERRPLKRFSTGSTYEGTWDAIGMCGYGVYTFPNGVVYEGEFEDNMFHGDGEMRYPDGTKLKGKWSNGEVTDRTIIFSDGVHYKDHNWTYCKPADRRYACEITEGIQPADQSFITKNKTIKKIPDGTYDVGDGFYDPQTGNVIDYDDHTRVIRVAVSNLKSWVTENCRVSPEAPPGPQPDLYKQWHVPTLEAPEMPKPACMSEHNSVTSFEQQSILSGHTGFASTLSRVSKSSWRKPKTDQGVPVEPFNLDQRLHSRTSVISQQVNRMREKLEASEKMCTSSMQ